VDLTEQGKDWLTPMFLPDTEPPVGVALEYAPTYPFQSRLSPRTMVLLVFCLAFHREIFEPLRVSSTRHFLIGTLVALVIVSQALPPDPHAS
jgi:hypothetical protein